MSKKYTINGVEVDYDTFDNAMNSNPNDFHNLSNIDGDDIPQIYKDQYKNDKWNDFMGRGRTLFTPRKRMLNSIKNKEEQLAEKKRKRLEERQKKMDAWGHQRTSQEAWDNHILLMETSERQWKADQAYNDEQSTKLMAVVIGGGFLLICILFSLSLYIG